MSMPQPLCVEGKGCPGSLGRRGEGCAGLLGVERAPRGSAEGLRKAPAPRCPVFAHSGCVRLPSPSCVSWLVVACFVKWRVCCLVDFLFPPKVPVWARGFLGETLPARGRQREAPRDPPHGSGAGGPPGCTALPAAPGRGVCPRRHPGAWSPSWHRQPVFIEHLLRAPCFKGHLLEHSP